MSPFILNTTPDKMTLLAYDINGQVGLFIFPPVYLINEVVA